MKSYTDIEQSKKLAEILPLESADMALCSKIQPLMTNYISAKKNFSNAGEIPIDPCWSLAALLSLIKDKCGYFELVYLKRTTDGRGNPLEDVHRLSIDEYDVYDKEMVDACYEMIIKLKENGKI